jgi:hypothetical protein
VKSSDSWGKKKASKTGNCVNLFIKTARMLSKSSGDVATISECGAKLIKALTEVTDDDKSMANLKGKIKEIKSIMEA